MIRKILSRILSFSTDKEFASELEQLVVQTGYKNRSMFLRDASIFFAEASLKGDLSGMQDDLEVEGTAVIYYQHGVENKLMDLRHSHSINNSSYHQNCLTTSHTCVDTMQISGNAGSIRDAIERLKNTKDVDCVKFITAPSRSAGCC